MELSTHHLLCLMESNQAGLKSMLTHYIDATVDSHYNAMKQNIVEMIQSGQVGPQITQVNVLPYTTQTTFSTGQSNMDSENSSLLSHTNDYLTTHKQNVVSEAADVHEHAFESTQPNATQMNSSNEQCPLILNNSTDQINLPCSSLGSTITTTSQLIKEECLEEKYCDCKDCLNEIKQEVEDENDETGQLIETKSRQVNSLSQSNSYDHHLNVDDYGQIGLNQTIDDDKEQPNGHGNTDNDTKQDCDWSEIEEVEFEDGQIMKIKEEDESDHEEVVGDDDTEIDSESDHGDEIADNQNEDLSMDNPPMNTTPPKPIRTQVIITRQFAKIAKRKQTRDDEQPLNEMNNRTNHQGTDGDQEDDNEEITLRSIKRPRTSRPSTSSNSDKKKQIITHTLRCPVCNEMVDKDGFKSHLKQHSIGAFCCLSKDCDQTFDSKIYLGKHLAQSHQSTTQWHCDKCPKNFPSYPLLSTHYNHNHKIGHFQCSFQACTFTGEYRKKVYDHVAQQHKQTLTCPNAGCHYKTPKPFNMKRHIRAHSGIMPYRCKWDECDYPSTDRSTTIRHIREKHFKGSTSAAIPICDYLEVNEKLLDTPDTNVL